MVDGTINPIEPSAWHFNPRSLVVLHVHMVFAEPELFANRFLDGRSAQHLPCSRILLSQLLTRIQLGFFVAVIRGLHFLKYISLFAVVLGLKFLRVQLTAHLQFLSILLVACLFTRSFLLVVCLFANLTRTVFFCLYACMILKYISFFVAVVLGLQFLRVPVGEA